MMDYKKKYLKYKKKYLTIKKLKGGMDQVVDRLVSIVSPRAEQSSRDVGVRSGEINFQKTFGLNASKKPGSLYNEKNMLEIERLRHHADKPIWSELQSELQSKPASEEQSKLQSEPAPEEQVFINIEDCQKEVARLNELLKEKGMEQNPPGAEPAPEPAQELTPPKPTST